MRGRSFISGVVVMTAAIAVLGAQARQRPLAPLPPDGQRVAPFFDGFYENPDGTITLSFGYSNLNRDETIEIPLGPDNFIEPKEFDGRQPTSFPVSPASGDPNAAASGRRDRERGVFTITVPAGFKGDVVWTLRHRGQTYKVPGRSKTGAYGLKWPMASGSIPPQLRFKADGPFGRGPAGIESPPLPATVGTPLSVTIWMNDDSQRTDEIQIKERGPARNAINVNWFKHTGPGPVAFDPPKSSIKELAGTATSAITFTQPGSYLLRVRADNFGRVDTSAGNQCCWTNGYVRVTVK